MLLQIYLYFYKDCDLNSIPTKTRCYFPGDLVNGEVDIAVAGMTMTSEREEVRI